VTRITVVRRALHVTLLVLAACSTPDRGALEAHAPALSIGEPADVGMSAEELARIEPAMQEMIDEGRTAGIVTLVARQGTIVHWEATGWRILDEDPLQRNDVFRIYSMTKPVTSVAVMILVEDGLLDLDEPLEGILPEFRDVQVYDGGELRPPRRSITIRDLLRHTSGLTYGLFGNSAVDRMYVQRLRALEMDAGPDLKETIETVASLPLLDDPGARWNYSVSTDVLGRVVEVASGMTLAEFFDTRIFEPLGMHDTAFHVAEEDLPRFTAVYTPTRAGLLVSDPPDGPFSRPPSWYSGGGGLTSTPLDYLRFTQMLLNEGTLAGVRVLRPASVRAMRTNQLDPALTPIRLGTTPVPNTGFGLGFAVTVEGSDEGRYWWSGIANTWFWIDPVEEIIGFAWTQNAAYGSTPIDAILRDIVADAVVESNRVAVGAR